MKILLIEPFMSGSHASWAESLKAKSRHQIDIWSLPGRHWKWRMYGAAVTFARMYDDCEVSYDLVVTTDMLDVATFKGLCVRALPPIVVYFHENQLSYPWSPQDNDVQEGRDFHYGFTNWTTALSADRVYFNSSYNLNSFFDEVGKLLKSMPDHQGKDLVEKTRSASTILPLGIQANLYVDWKKQYDHPVFIWNHRWEYDKDPETFFHALEALKRRQIPFKLIVCGQSYTQYPAIFDEVESKFKDELIHFGFAADGLAYRKLLELANVIPVTSKQEFFGESVMEAIAAGCMPVLPNALAYPGHFPESLQHHFLYDTPEELTERLADLALNLKPALPLIEVAQALARKYDWSNLIEHYDHAFESVLIHEA